ncbi:MAG: ankyrin repeat domain-containing protein [Terracidiphilus sp.]
MKRFGVITLTAAFLAICLAGNQGSAQPSGGQSSAGGTGDKTQQLIAAAQAGGLDQVKAAVTAGANVNARGTYGMTPLMMSAFFGKSDIVSFLIGAHADVNLKNDGGNTALALAAFKGEAEIAKSLIAAGADVNNANTDGDSALTLTVRKGCVDCAKALIDAGADVNLQEDSQGSSALMDAAEAGNMQIVTALLQAHANVATKDNEGKTAIDRAGENAAVSGALRSAAANASGSGTAQIDGDALIAQFAQQGLGGKAHIDFSRDEISQTTVTPDGVKLSYSTDHEWTGPVTLRAFDAGGVPSYAIGVMAAKVYENGGVAEGVVPVGAGTVYRVIGTVNFLGATITSAGTGPLWFVVFNLSKSDDAKPGFKTSGRLAPISFAIGSDKGGAGSPASKPAFVSLVHVGGAVSATLKDGTQIKFP